MKKFLSVILTIFIMIFSIGAMMASCKNDENSTNQTQTEESTLTDEEKVRCAVTSKARLLYFRTTIGGNELKTSYSTITNLSWSGKTKCRVSGIIVMIDIYGTAWKNTFDCEVTYSESSDKWVAGSFNYKNNYWSRN